MEKSVRKVTSRVLRWKIREECVLCFDKRGREDLSGKMTVVLRAEGTLCVCVCVKLPEWGRACGALVVGQYSEALHSSPPPLCSDV